VDRVSIERMCAGKEFQTGSTLHIATSPGGSSHGHKNVHTNLAKAGHAVFGDMLADRPTDTLIAILRSPNEME